MALFSEEFAGWQNADFDAFAPLKWRSNRFTPERTRVRLRLAAALEQAAARAGLSTIGLQLWASRQDPALSNQHEVRSLIVAWTRPQAEDVEAAQPYVGMLVDEEAVTLRLRLPVLHKMAWQPLLGTLAELAQLAGMHARVGDSEVPVDTLANTEIAGDLQLERAMPRAEALGGMLTVDELAAWSAVVLPILAQLLHLQLATLEIPSAQPEPQQEVLETLGVPEVQPQRETTPIPGRDPLPRRGYRPQWAPPKDSKTLSEGVRPPIERIAPPTWRPEPPKRPEPPRYPPPRQLEMRPPERRFQNDQPQRGRPFELGPAPQKLPEKQGILAAGARVELQRGLFAGKQGTVAEVAGNHVQVLLGLMSVRVPTADLRVV